MEVTFKNDLEKQLMCMTIKVKKRNFVKERQVALSWRQVEEILNKQFVCPKTHQLGECHDKCLKIDNNWDNLCEQTWVFDLKPIRTKRQPSQKKQSTRTVKK